MGRDCRWMTLIRRDCLFTLGGSGRLNECREREGRYWFVSLKDCIRFNLFRHLSRLYLAHAHNVFRKVVAESGVDGGIVHGDQRFDQIRRAESDGHCCFGSPGSNMSLIWM